MSSTKQITGSWYRRCLWLGLACGLGGVLIAMLAVLTGPVSDAANEVVSGNPADPSRLAGAVGEALVATVVAGIFAVPGGIMAIVCVIALARARTLSGAIRLDERP